MKGKLRPTSSEISPRTNSKNHQISRDASGHYRSLRYVQQRTLYSPSILTPLLETKKSSSRRDKDRSRSFRDDDDNDDNNNTKGKQVARVKKHDDESAPEDSDSDRKRKKKSSKSKDKKSKSKSRSRRHHDDDDDDDDEDDDNEVIVTKTQKYKDVSYGDLDHTYAIALGECFGAIPGKVAKWCDDGLVQLDVTTGLLEAKKLVKVQRDDDEKKKWAAFEKKYKRQMEDRNEMAKGRGGGPSVVFVEGPPQPMRGCPDCRWLGGYCGYH